MNVNDLDIIEENYMCVIYSKIVCLFEVVVQCFGILVGCMLEEEKGLQDYGCYFGIVFQLIDDLFDYNVDGEQLGKNVGDDLNEGKLMLLLLYVMYYGILEQVQMICIVIEQGNGCYFLELVLEVMNVCGFFEWMCQCVEEEVDKVIVVLQVFLDIFW